MQGVDQCLVEYFCVAALKMSSIGGCFLTHLHFLLPQEGRSVVLGSVLTPCCRSVFVCITMLPIVLYLSTIELGRRPNNIYLKRFK